MALGSALYNEFMRVPPQKKFGGRNVNSVAQMKQSKTCSVVTSECACAILFGRVTSSRRRAQANATAASYWLRCAIDDGGRLDQTSPPCNAPRAADEVCTATLPRLFSCFVIFIFHYYFIDAARTACGAGSMKRSGVRPSVCPSVCPITRPTHAAAAGLLLSGGVATGWTAVDMSTQWCIGRGRVYAGIRRIPTSRFF